MFAEIEKGDVLVPSPLLTFVSPQVRLHFQYGPDGRLTSPQVPAGNMRDLAERGTFALTGSSPPPYVSKSLAGSSTVKISHPSSRSRRR